MDFYVILGVERTASAIDVKRAYRRLARKYHPDINPGDREAEAFFRRVAEAYETLRDPDRRQEYDAHGVRAHVSAPVAVEFQGFDFSGSLASGGASVTFSDLFSDVFEDTAERQTESDAVARGGDLYGEIALSFEEALQGAERRLTVTRLDVCDRCEGTGKRRAVEGRCGQCHGVGTTRWRRGHMVFSKSCKHCGGSGRLRHRNCDACGADGIAPRDENITIHVPAGIDNGARLRVEAKGNAGRRGGAPGDLYITARVAPHRVLHREGDDLHLQVPIAIHEAALGANIDVPTLDGAVRLRVPPGTQTGQRFRLRARGVPSPHTGDRGDLIVEVRVVLPSIEDEQSKELLREFGRIHSSNPRKGLFEA